MLKVSPARKGRFVSLVSKVPASCFVYKIKSKKKSHININFCSSCNALFFFYVKTTSINTKILNMPDSKNLPPCNPCFSENKQDLVKKQQLTIGLALVILKTSINTQSSHAILNSYHLSSPPPELPEKPISPLRERMNQCNALLSTSQPPAGLQGLLALQDMILNKKCKKLI